MLLIILIGAALSYESPEPAHLTAGAGVDAAEAMPWRWRCTTGVAERSGAGFPAKNPLSHARISTSRYAMASDDERIRSGWRPV